jgi:transposase
MALVVLSVLEQRLDAVRAVLAGADVTGVAARLGVHRSTVHRWTARYLTDQLAGLADRSHRPASCPHQSPTGVEVAVAEMRRQHPRWGGKRIRMELLRRPVEWQYLFLPARWTELRQAIVLPEKDSVRLVFTDHGVQQPETC